jgi:hypothetical protein
MSEPIVTKQRVPRGRPKQYEFKDQSAYFKDYYQKNKAKWNSDYLCPACDLYCSIINKSRHFKSRFHLNNVENKKILVNNIPIASLVSTAQDDTKIIVVDAPTTVIDTQNLFCHM